MKKRHLVKLVTIIKDSLSAHRMANWDDKKVSETVAEVITKRFAKYIKDQESLDKLGMTEEDAMIPPNALNR